MTISDLNWYPAAIGGGFITSHRFPNGRIARLRYLGEGDFTLAILESDQRVHSVEKKLDRRTIESRLTFYQMCA